MSTGGEGMRQRRSVGGAARGLIDGKDAATARAAARPGDALNEAVMKERYGRVHVTRTCGERVSAWCRKSFTPEFGKTLFPPVTWLPEYKDDACGKIRGDIIAGLTVAIVVIPQGLSYAALAMLNPVVGFYTTIFPSLVYMLFGTSRECHIGPFALVALLTADAVLVCLPDAGDVANLSAPVNACGIEFDNYDDASLNTAAALALLVGCFQIAFGLLGIGQVVMSIVSDPFVSGFTTGAAFLIGASQLSGLFGVPGYRSDTIFITIYYVIEQIADGMANWMAFAIGFSSLVMLFIFRHINKTVLAGKIPIPGELITVVLAGLLSEYGGGWQAVNSTMANASMATVAADGAADVVYERVTLYERYGFDVVGSVSSGIPPPRVPSMTTELVSALVGPAIVISFVGYMVGVAVSKLFADANDYEISGMQELFATGLANFVGGFFNCFPAAASLSRTAIVAASGGRTQLHNLFSVAILIIVLYGLAFLLAPLPKATLSAVVYIALIGLFLGFRQLRDAFAIRWQDGMIWLVAFLSTICLGVTVGIGIGVGFSLLLLLYRISHPYNAILGNVPGTVAFRSVKRFRALQMNNVKVFRFDASLGFVNRDFFEECVLKVAAGTHPHSKFDNHALPKILIIQATSINSIDMSALRSLAKLILRLKRRGVDLLLCSAKWDVRTLLERGARSKQAAAIRARKAAECCRCIPANAKPAAGDAAPQPVVDSGGSGAGEGAKEVRLEVLGGSGSNGVDDGREGGAAAAVAAAAGEGAKAEEAAATTTATEKEEAEAPAEAKAGGAGAAGDTPNPSAPKPAGDPLQDLDAFAVVSKRNIFPTLSDALRFIQNKYGYQFDDDLALSPELDFYFAGAASDGGVLESYEHAEPSPRPSGANRDAGSGEPAETAPPARAAEVPAGEGRPLLHTAQDGDGDGGDGDGDGDGDGGGGDGSDNSATAGGRGEGGHHGSEDAGRRSAARGADVSGPPADGR